jgi:hypothetical protein
MMGASHSKGENRNWKAFLGGLFSLFNGLLGTGPVIIPAVFLQSGVLLAIIWFTIISL